MPERAHSYHEQGRICKHSSDEPCEAAGRSPVDGSAGSTPRRRRIVGAGRVQGAFADHVAAIGGARAVRLAGSLDRSLASLAVTQVMGALLRVTVSGRRLRGAR